jgi:pyruvate dehydrogenase E1 component alpha subunit
VTAVARPAADRASAYGLEPVVIDGNDVEVVYASIGQAVERARRGGGPSLIEALTYRHKGHSRTDPARYRPEGELEEWMTKDPITLFAQRLLGAGWDRDELDRIEHAVIEDVQSAAERALASPPPPESELFTDVFCAGETTWRN